MKICPACQEPGSCDPKSRGKTDNRKSSTGDPNTGVSRKKILNGYKYVFKNSGIFSDNRSKDTGMEYILNQMDIPQLKKILKLRTI